LVLYAAHIAKPDAEMAIARNRISEITAEDRETVFTRDASWRTVNMLIPR
jgi:hypothetical protein